MANPYSFKGWKFRTWLTKNSGALKNVILALVALATFFSTSWGVGASAALTGLITALSKLILDSIDYYIQD